MLIPVGGVDVSLVCFSGLLHERHLRDDNVQRPSETWPVLSTLLLSLPPCRVSEVIQQQYNNNNNDDDDNNIIIIIIIIIFISSSSSRSSSSDSSSGRFSNSLACVAVCCSCVWPDVCGSLLQLRVTRRVWQFVTARYHGVPTNDGDAGLREGDGVVVHGHRLPVWWRRRKSR